MEQARTLAALVMAVIALISIGQVASDHSASNGEATARAAAVDVARRFAIALTTYDYAHSDVQRNQLRQVADPAVVEQATAALPDMHNLAASSIGSVGAVSIAGFNGITASMVIQTDQVVSNNLVGRGRTMTGMLDCELRPNRDGVWKVDSFRWLVPPGPPS